MSPKYESNVLFSTTMYTTCLIGDGLSADGARPFGHSTGEGLSAGAHGSGFSSRPLLAITCDVQVSYCEDLESAGRPTWLTAPPVVVPSNSTLPSPPGPNPTPLALVTHSRVPPFGPGTAASADGYQPVGI